MFELSEEHLIMSSDDHKLKLTTHRVIFDNTKKREQIMLEDYQGHEFVTAHVGTYKGLAILTNSISILVLYLIWSSQDFSFIELVRSMFMIPFLLLSGFTFFLYRLSRRYFIRIIGKYNTIEVRIENPKHKSIKRFLQRIKDESDLQKKKYSVEQKNV
ncbi:MAG TPA: hypothetical protein PKG90_04975 [Chitinophagaceae bacterium]|nr:hypothetical protein [Chitinophagaceae bacterium]HNU15692.1 hypothetical protein [Chitinophagaceae bacterium]